MVVRANMTLNECIQRVKKVGRSSQSRERPHHQSTTKERRWSRSPTSQENGTRQGHARTLAGKACGSAKGMWTETASKTWRAVLSLLFSVGWIHRVVHRVLSSASVPTTKITASRFLRNRAKLRHAQKLFHCIPAAARSRTEISALTAFGLLWTPARLSQHQCHMSLLVHKRNRI
jgi:hypothetical protein